MALEKETAYHDGYHKAPGVYSFIKKGVWGSWLNLHETPSMQQTFSSSRPANAASSPHVERFERHKDDEKDVVAEGYDREKGIAFVVK